MQLLVRLATFLAALFFLTTPVAGLHWKQQCMTKHPAIWDTLDRFCKQLGTKAMTPSTAAFNGITSKGYDSKVTIAIRGGCSPAQWIPQEYCYSQFAAMCTHINPNGETKLRTFNGCQSWQINFKPAGPPGGCIGKKGASGC